MARFPSNLRDLVEVPMFDLDGGFTVRRGLIFIGVLLLATGISASLQTRMVERYRHCPASRSIEVIVPSQSEYSRYFGISDQKTLVEIKVTTQQKAVVKIRSRGVSIFKRRISPGTYSWNVTLVDPEGEYTLVVGNPCRSRLSLVLHLGFYVISVETERPHVDAALLVMAVGLSTLLLGLATSPLNVPSFMIALHFLGAASFLHSMGFIFKVPLFFLSSLIAFILTNIFFLGLLARWIRSTPTVLRGLDLSVIIGLCLSIQISTAFFLIPTYIGKTGLIPEKDVTLKMVHANPMLGVCDHLEPGTDERIIRNHFKLIGSLGAEWVRLDMSWEKIEPAQDTWRFEHWDSLVRISSHYGLRILPVISGTPRWASSHPDLDSYHTYPPRDFTDFGIFIRKVVERYGRKIYLWEIWNEPDAQFWKGSTQEYCRLLQETDSALRVADPTAKIVLGGVSSTSLHFLKELLSLGALDYVDIVGIHLYGSDSGDVLKRAENFIDVLDESSETIPVWVTEIGLSTPFQYNTEEDQASFLERVFTELSTMSRIQRLFWYELKDSGLLFFWSEHNFGLVRFNLTPKASFRAYLRLAETLRRDQSMV